MKRIVLGLGVLCVAIGFVVWLVHYLTTGHITITTGDAGTTITLTKVPGDDNSASKAFSAQAQGHLSLTVSTGQYIASVQHNSVATTQVINLGAHQSLTYSLTAPETSGIEPVAYQNAHDLAVDGSHLRYLNTSDGGIYQIDAQNNISQTSSAVHFSSIKWANANYGVGQDGGGRLYTIANGGARALSNSAPDNGKVDLYVIAPNQEIYFSIGPTIYRETQTSGVTKLFTDSKPFSTLLAASGKVALVNSPVDGGAATTPYVMVVSDSGKSFKKNIQMPPMAAWSPDGTHLVSADVDDKDGLELYDSSLQKVAQIPGANINNVIWLDNYSLAYSVTSELWTYNLLTERASLLANTPLSAGITEQAVSDDGAYLYVVMLDDQNNYAVRRVGLKGQSVSQTIYNLQDILPDNESNYALSLVNFSGPPTILVQPFPDGGPQNYLQEAGTLLQQDGFDSSKLRFEQLPIQSGE